MFSVEQCDSLAVLASVGLGFLYIKSVDELKAEAAEKAAAVSKAQKVLGFF